MSRTLAGRVVRTRPNLHPSLVLCSAGDLITQARLLNSAGYSVAAVTTARAAVERQLKTMAFTHPAWKQTPVKRGMRRYTMFLFSMGVVSKATSRRLDDFGARANGIVHGAPADRWRAASIIRRGADVLALLEGGAGC